MVGVWVAPTRKKIKISPKWSLALSKWNQKVWRGKSASELFKASVHMNLTSTGSNLLDTNGQILCLFSVFDHCPTMFAIFFSKRSGLVLSSVSCVCLGCWRNTQEEMGFTLESLFSINIYYTCITIKRWIHSVIYHYWIFIIHFEFYIYVLKQYQLLHKVWWL